MEIIEEAERITKEVDMKQVKNLATKAKVVRAQGLIRSSLLPNLTMLQKAANKEDAHTTCVLLEETRWQEATYRVAF